MQHSELDEHGQIIADGPDERAYKTFLDYDAFGRLGRQSAPKSTATDRGLLIWSSAVFDANDNVVRQVQPHFARAEGNDPIDPTDPAALPATTATYDRMDRPLVVGNPDTSVDPAGERIRYTYDAAGRVATQEEPKGAVSATTSDYTTAYAYEPDGPPHRVGPRLPAGRTMTPVDGVQVSCSPGCSQPQSVDRVPSEPSGCPCWPPPASPPTSSPTPARGR